MLFPGQLSNTTQLADYYHDCDMCLTLPTNSSAAVLLSYVKAMYVGNL